MASKRKSTTSEIADEESKRRQQEIRTNENNMNASCKCGIDYSWLVDLVRRVVREELERDRSPRVRANQCVGISEAKPLESRFTRKLHHIYFTQSKILAEDGAPVEIALFDVESKGRTNQCAGISEAKPFELRFTRKLHHTYFTLSNILAKDGALVEIALFDVGSQSIVSDGPMSSIRIEICVLDGDFGSNGTAQEFNANILRQREGKEPLLKGDTSIKLKGGVGVIPKIVFTDNSSWVRTGNFRLAAKSNEPNIGECASEPFKVKDNRGESYKKHDHPSLNDEIWRLRKVGKDGPIRRELFSAGIKTVKDLLQLHTTNPFLLKEKFGKLPRKSREAIIEHAKACVVGDSEHYLYYPPGQSIGLLLNAIYEVVKVSFDGQPFRSPDTFNSNEKCLVEIGKQIAYQNVKDFSLLEDPLAIGQFSAPDQFLQQFQSDLSAAQQGQPGLGGAAYDSRVLTYAQPGFYWPIQFPNDVPPTTWEQRNVFHFEAELNNNSSLPISAVHMSCTWKRRTVWNKIRAALKWVISAKHYAAVNRKGKQIKLM